MACFSMGVFRRSFWAALLALGVNGCAAGPASQTPAGAGERGFSAAPDIERLTPAQAAAVETLTGLEFPPFYDDVKAYCERNMPPPLTYVAHVEGYAEEIACSSVAGCVGPVTQYGYAFVEVDFSPRGMNHSGVAPGKYHVAFADEKDPACRLYERALKRLNENEKRFLPSLPEGRCIAMTPIDTFEARYVLKQQARSTDRNGPLRVTRQGRYIVDQETGEVVAEAMRLDFRHNTDVMSWAVGCTNNSEDFVQRTIPPARQ